MSFFILVLWLQMSAPTMPCQSAKLYYNSVLVDEEPHCGLLNQVVNMPTALDDITRAEFAEAAQRAADETDGHLLQIPITAKDYSKTPLYLAKPVGLAVYGRMTGEPPSDGDVGCEIVVELLHCKNHFGEESWLRIYGNPLDDMTRRKLLNFESL